MARCYGKVTPHWHLHTSPSADAVHCPLQGMELRNCTDTLRATKAMQVSALHAARIQETLIKVIGRTEIFTTSHLPSRNQLLQSRSSVPKRQIPACSSRVTVPMDEPGHCHLQLRGKHGQVELPLSKQFMFDRILPIFWAGKWCILSVKAFISSKLCDKIWGQIFVAKRIYSAN